MYFRDHNPPHFHAEFAEYSAEIDIRDGSYREGVLPKRIHALVLEWWAQHRDELQVNWERVRREEEPLPIAPLE